MCGLLFCHGIPYKCHRRRKHRQEKQFLFVQVVKHHHSLFFRQLNMSMCPYSGERTHTLLLQKDLLNTTIHEYERVTHCVRQCAFGAIKDQGTPFFYYTRLTDISEIRFLRMGDYLLQGFVIYKRLGKHLAAVKGSNRKKLKLVGNKIQNNPDVSCSVLMHR